MSATKKNIRKSGENENLTAANPGRQNKKQTQKLKISKPDEAAEKEADRMADYVVSKENNKPQIPSVSYFSAVQENYINRQPIEEEEELQMKTDSRPKENKGSGWLATQLKRHNNAGQTLDKPLANFMQVRFGTSFGDVKVHTGSKASEMNQSIGARAFTFGKDIYFNSGNYRPDTLAGKHLLAHELTHVIQQKGIQPKLIQRDNGEGGSAAPTTSEATTARTSVGSGPRSSPHPLADFVAGIIRRQSTDSRMQRHLRNLARALQGLAVESTAETTDQPSTSVERMSALGIPHAFQTTAREIIADPDFRQLRSQLISRIGSSDEAALLTILCAGLAAYLADVDLSGEHAFDLGSGFALGVGADVGSVQDLQFRHIQLFARYASSHFRTQLGGRVSRTEEGEWVVRGDGEVRLGNNLSNITARVRIDSTGQLQLTGILTSGHTFGGTNRLQFITSVSHSMGGEEEQTIISPGVRGQFSFGPDQSLRLGGNLEFTTGSGLTGATGFLEYQQDSIRLRIEGNITGLPEDVSISPGRDIRVQGLIEFPFDLNIR